jgi:predicted transcriptional regulator
MDDDIRERLGALAEATGRDQLDLAVEQIAAYQRSLRATRGALQDVRDARHFEQFPLSVRP